MRYVYFVSYMVKPDDETPGLFGFGNLDATLSGPIDSIEPLTEIAAQLRRLNPDRSYVVMNYQLLRAEP